MCRQMWISRQSMRQKLRLSEKCEILSKKQEFCVLVSFVWNLKLARLEVRVDGQAHASSGDLGIRLSTISIARLLRRINWKEQLKWCKRKCSDTNYFGHLSSLCNATIESDGVALRSYNFLVFFPCGSLKSIVQMDCLEADHRTRGWLIHQSELSRLPVDFQLTSHTHTSRYAHFRRKHAHFRRVSKSEAIHPI